MADITELAPLFRKAAEVIEQRGHAKDTFESETGAVCAVGALRVAAGYDAENVSGLEPWEAAQFLSPRICSNIIDEDPIERVADWNDAAGRTPAEVVQALRDAATAAEAVAA